MRNMALKPQPQLPTFASWMILCMLFQVAMVSSTTVFNSQMSGKSSPWIERDRSLTLASPSPLRTSTWLRIRGGKTSEGAEEDADGDDNDDSNDNETEDETEDEVAPAITVKTKGGRKTVSLSKSSSFSLKSIIKSIMNFLRPMFMSTPKPNKARGKASANSNSKSGGASIATIEHLEKSFKSGDPSARVQKELRSFIANPPEGCKLAVGANIRSWVVTLEGAPGTIYAGEKYKLKLVFPKDYPSKPPSVYFLKPTPRHQHVYSNGDICLNLLGRDWRPTMTAQALVVSILSMLSSAKEKKIPQDNAMHSDNPPGQQQEGWMYHDDKC